MLDFLSPQEPVTVLGLWWALKAHCVVNHKCSGLMNISKDLKIL